MQSYQLAKRAWPLSLSYYVHKMNVRNVVLTLMAEGEETMTKKGIFSVLSCFCCSVILSRTEN